MTIPSWRDLWQMSIESGHDGLGAQWGGFTVALRESRGGRPVWRLEDGNRSSWIPEAVASTLFREHFASSWGVPPDDELIRERLAERFLAELKSDDG